MGSTHVLWISGGDTEKYEIVLDTPPTQYSQLVHLQ